jgi:hypothetical protein
MASRLWTWNQSSTSIDKAAHAIGFGPRSIASGIRLTQHLVPACVSTRAQDARPPALKAEILLLAPASGPVLIGSARILRNTSIVSRPGARSRPTRTADPRDVPGDIDPSTRHKGNPGPPRARRS